MQEHGELIRLEAGVAVNVLEPLAAAGSFAQHPLELGLTLRFVRPESRFCVTVAQQAIGQDDNVLDGQRRPQSDGEMSGVSAVSGQHDLAVMPAPIADIPEAEPLGRRTTGNLSDEPVTAQIVLEKPFQDGKRRLAGHRVEAQASPGLAGAFHHECA